MPTVSIIDLTDPQDRSPVRAGGNAKRVAPSSLSLPHHHVYRSRRDELTQLASRGLLLDRVTAALAQPHASPAPFALFFVNLDRFTWANDSVGREGGDAILRGVASRLQQVATTTDTVARVDGDEFAVLCPGIDEPDTAHDIARRIGVALDPPFTVGGDHIFVTASVGVVIVSNSTRTTTLDVMRDASVAMRRVRSRGGAGFEVFDETMRVNFSKRAGIDNALRQAVQSDQFFLHYQPVVQLADGRVSGMEALLRWDHPEWGSITPDEFIPVAESSGVINNIGDWVLHEALRQTAEWELMAEPGRAPTVAINLSARQFLHPNLAHNISDALRLHNVHPENVCFEITESVLMDDLDSTTSALHALKDLGVRLAVDDFGTGYSSLAYLKRFPVDSVKVDRSFIDGLGIDPEDSAIVQAVIGMSRALRLGTVAEGVETPEQVTALRELGCEIGQGFHFARPQPPAALAKLVASGGILP